MTLPDDNQKSLTLRIERVNSQGLGVAYFQEQKYLVPYAMTGELVNANVLAIKKNVAICSLNSVLEPSIKRVKPLCEVYEACGGCQLQHINYSEQLRLKTQWLETLIAPNFPQTEIANIIASPQEYFYRNRITLHRNRKVFGYYQSQTHELVPIQNCVIASEALNQKLEASILRQKSPIELRETEGSSFLQVNTGQNDNLVKTVLEAVGKKKSQEILELYSGSGNLSFPLSEICKKITAVEGDKAASELAETKRLAQKNKKVQFVQGAVEDVLFEMRKNYVRFDTIVCDPPRTGLGVAVNFLDKFAAKKIVYVSCDPQSFVNDVKVLTQKNYTLQKITPLDMFPQTTHVEVVGLLGANT